MLSSTVVKTSSNVIINYQQYLYPILINNYINKNINKNYKNYTTTTTPIESNSNKFKKEFLKNLKLYNNSHNIIRKNNSNGNNNITKFFNNNNIDNNKVMKHFYSSSRLNYKQQQQQQQQRNEEILNESIGHSLLPIINRLQENASLIGTEITLPQIIVVGSQSSGKSSVLENLVGRDFLPRGSGLVTRRPLILQLYQTQKTQDNDNDDDTDNDSRIEEWGEFSHTGNKRFNFEEIKEEISKETERVAGPNKNISSESIVLKIYSPNVIPLTLVDLPGLTRVAIDDQPPDIEEKIRSMIIQHISNPNSIILAITPSNQDIVTSDALKLAQQVDPLGKRTIGVLTKLDLMDKGTDAIDILLGNSIPLNLGFVGVINRSQQDINNNKPITQMLIDESKWFEQHPVYNRINNQLGTKYLAQKCNKILTRHIRDTFPSVKNQIRHLIKKYEAELEKYGDAIPTKSGEKSRLLLDILNKFSQQYKSDLDGTNDELVLNSFNGGARIRYIFQQAFQQHSNQNGGSEPFDWLSDQQLKVALRNASGLRSTMFIPQKTFDSLIRKQIERVKEPMIKSSEHVLDELLRILTQADYSHVLSRFPVLKERIVEVSNNSLRKLLKPCNQMISDLVDAEASFINTTHPNYIVQLNNLLASSSSSSFVPPSTYIPNQQQQSSQHPSNPYNDALNPYNIDRSYPIDSQIKQQQQQQKQQLQSQQQQSSGFLSRIFGSSQSSIPQPSPQQQQQLPKRQQQTNNMVIQDRPQQPSNLEQYGLNDITDEERKQIYLLRRLLMVYYTDIAQFNIQQNTMKVISLLLIDRSKDILQQELINSLYDQSLVDQLLRENELVIAKRNECIYKLDLLKKAKKSLSNTENDLPLNLY